MSSSSPPSKSELNERLARLEEKLDHQSEILERLEGDLEDDLEDLEDDLADVKPRTDRLWLIYKGGKWISALLVGSGLVGTAVTSLF